MFAYHNGKIVDLDSDEAKDLLPKLHTEWMIYGHQVKMRRKKRSLYWDWCACAETAEELIERLRSNYSKVIEERRRYHTEEVARLEAIIEECFDRNTKAIEALDKAEAAWKKKEVK